MTASETVGFRRSALEDLRPSQVVFSERAGPCEILTSLGGQRRKILSPDFICGGCRRQAQRACGTSPLTSTCKGMSDCART